MARAMGLHAQSLIGLQEQNGRSLFHPGRCEECERCGDQVRLSQARQGTASRQEQGQSQGVGEILRRRSEEHTSELQSLMRISYAVFCLKKKTQKTKYLA